MFATPASPGDPDLHHPLQYRKQEALWKQYCSLKHKEFCLCGDFLAHFKWPTGEGGGGNRDAAGIVPTGGDITSGEEDMVGATGGGEGDLTDLELLQ
nr:ORF2 [Torque teno Leptonychotes weddellii virus 1]